MTIGAVSSAANPTSQSSNLGLQDFMKILLTQLTYQDPLKPMDNQEFIAQVAQFTSLEQAQQLNSKLEQLVINQSALQSVGLIGRTVTAQSGGASITGTVASISLSGDVPLISITTAAGVVTDISLSQVSSVR